MATSILREVSCRHGDDVDTCLGEIGGVGRERQVRGLDKFDFRYFERAVAARAQRIDAALIDIEADHRAALAKLDGKRQADIAEADNGDRFDL